MPDGLRFKIANSAPHMARGLQDLSGFARKSRILLSTSNFPRYDGDSTTPFILHLAQDLQRLGWHVDVLAPHAPGAQTHEQLAGVPVWRYRYLWPESFQTVCYQGGALVNLRRDRTNAVKLPALVGSQAVSISSRLLSRRYDLLHSHWILPQGFVGALAARPLGIPHVVTVHGGDIFALQASLLRPFKRFALRGCTAVTVNSQATEKAVLDLAPGLKAVHRIPMGVSEAQPDDAAVVAFRQRYRQGSGPLLAFVGRVVEEKGVTDLLRAVQLLIPQLPDVSAVVVGEGQDRAAAERLAQELGITDRVHFTGWIASARIPEVMTAADIFVGPSRRGRDGWKEAQGLTFAEALLAGTPVIATGLGGTVDLVRHEESGLLVDEKAPAQIAAAVARLTSDPALSQRLAETGGKLVQGYYTRSASAKAFSQLFTTLLPQRCQTDHGRHPRSVL
jgi:glycosyltransferase involved in cell wall biosynthesis